MQLPWPAALWAPPDWFDLLGAHDPYRDNGEPAVGVAGKRAGRLFLSRQGGWASVPGEPPGALDDAQPRRCLRTATVASYFVKSGRGTETEAILAAFRELRDEVAELRQWLPSS
jgi:hypothetical protein